MAYFPATNSFFVVATATPKPRSVLESFPPRRRLSSASPLESFPPRRVSSASPLKLKAQNKDDYPLPSPLRLGTGRVQIVISDVKVILNLDGNGFFKSNTNVPLLDDMLAQIAYWGSFNLEVMVKGVADPIRIIDDVAKALGSALIEAAGDKTKTKQLGNCAFPPDGAVVQVSLDLCGPSLLNFGLRTPKSSVGKYDLEVVKKFFKELTSASDMTVFIRQLAVQEDSDSLIEATFRAFALALRMATELK